MGFNQCKDGITLVNPKELDAFAQIGLIGIDLAQIGFDIDGIDTNSRDSSKCHEKASSSLKCCKHPNQIHIEKSDKFEKCPTTATTTSTPIISTTSTSKPIISTTDKSPEQKHKCGQRNKESIVGGERFLPSENDSKFNSVSAVFEWPHMCYLKTKDDSLKHL